MKYILLGLVLTTSAGPAISEAYDSAARLPQGIDQPNPVAAPAAPPSDRITIFSAKSVVTLDPAVPTGTAVAVKDGRILGVGSLDEMKGWAADPSQLDIDTQFQDDVILPGFIEAHMHPQLTGILWEGVYVGRFDRISPDGEVIPGAATKQAVLDRLKAAAANMPANADWLIGWGYQPEFFGDSPLTRADLDPISNRHPMFIENLSMHIYYANSKAFKAAGIGDDTTIEGILKTDGKPNGVVQEISAALAFISKLRPLDQKALVKATWNSAKQAHRVGVTTFADLSFGSIPGAYEAYKAVESDPTFPVRTVLNPLIQVFQQPQVVSEGGLDALAEWHKADTDRLSFGGVKFVVDGSLQGYTGLMLWPYYFRTFQNGVANISQDDLNKWVGEVHKRGFHSVIHTNANGATEMAIEAVEAAQRAYPGIVTRDRLEHNQMVTQSQLVRMKELGLSTNIFSNHIYYWGDLHYSTFLGPDRAEAMDPAGSAQRLGIPFSLHSDDSVTPVDPLFSMWVATTRQTMSGRVLGPSERLTIPQALHAVTLGAAYLLGQDDKKGSIATGKLADFTILDRDPLSLSDPSDLRQIKVLGTVVGGKPFPATSP